jgi:hypothetical protein
MRVEKKKNEKGKMRGRGQEMIKGGNKLSWFLGFSFQPSTSFQLQY